MLGVIAACLGLRIKSPTVVQSKVEGFQWVVQSCAAPSRGCGTVVWLELTVHLIAGQ